MARSEPSKTGRLRNEPQMSGSFSQTTACTVQIDKEAFISNGVTPNILYWTRFIMQYTVFFLFLHLHPFMPAYFQKTTCISPYYTKELTSVY